MSSLSHLAASDDWRDWLWCGDEFWWSIVGPRDLVLDGQSVSRPHKREKRGEYSNAFSRRFCPNVRFCFARVDLLGLRAWSDDLNVILLEFLDDDTKLTQSFTGTGKDCDKHTQDTPPRSICWFVSRVASINLDETSGNAAVPFFAVFHMALLFVCAVKQDLSFLFHSVTRPAAIAAMVLVSFAGARRRAMWCWSTFFS